MDIADYFSTFTSNLRISKDDVSKISDRYKQITKRLNIDFYSSYSDTKHSLYVGSYGRSTDIITSDIDMIFMLPSDLYSKYDARLYNGQSELLQTVLRSLRTTYPTSYLSADGQVIKLSFYDGIAFEIMPAFELTDGSFRFPDSNNGGSWGNTNPRPEIQAIRNADALYNNNLRRLCRMIRAWKYNCDVPMGGLLIDTLANNFIKNWVYNNESYLYYDLMTRDFMLFLSEQNRNQTYWRALGSNQHIYRKGLFEAKAKKAYNLAVEALHAYDKKYYYTATSKWREIYGTKFPL